MAKLRKLVARAHRSIPGLNFIKLKIWIHSFFYRQQQLRSLNAVTGSSAMSLAAKNGVVSKAQNVPAWKRLGLKLKYAREVAEDGPQHPESSRDDANQ